MCDECLYSIAYFHVDLFGESQAPRKYTVFSRLVLNHNYSFINASVIKPRTTAGALFWRQFLWQREQ